MRKIWFLLGLSLILMLAACGFADNNNNANEGNDNSNDSEDSAEEAEDDTINIFEDSEIPTLDSSHAHDLNGFSTLNNINEGLYRGDEDNKPQPALAEDEEVNDEETEYTFTLRDDAEWSNGDPVTADDFEYAWKRTFDEVGHYADMFAKANIENAQDILDEEKDPDDLGVEAVDDQTLKVTLEDPSPIFKQLLTFPTFFPLNEDFVEDAGDDYGTEADKVLYNGAFVLDSWEHDKGWVMKKNPDYWDADEVELEEINVNVVDDNSTLVNLWETGELDRIELSASYVDEYEDDDNFFVDERPSTIFMRMNHNLDEFQNTNIRKAIDMAIDKESMADVILNDGSKPMYSLIPSDFFYSPDDEDFRDVNGSFNEGSEEEAKELFDEGLDELGEDELEIELTVSDDEDHQKIAEYVKDQVESNLEDITLDVKKVPFEARLEQEEDVDYDMVVSTWGPDYNDPLTFLDMWESDGSANRMDYSNEEYDELISDIKEETDDEKRFDMMLEAEHAFLDDMEIVPLIQDADSGLIKQNIKGMVRHPASPEYDFKWTSVE